MDRYKVLENPAWHKAPPVTYLGASDKEKLNDGLCETLFLMARANQVQAAGLTDPDQCAKHLQLAMRCNQAAETAAGAERGVRAIWEQRAELNRLAGNETDALTLLEKASKVALRVDRDYFMLGHKYAMEGNFRKALPLLQEATRQNPRNFAAWFVRGNCHFEMVQDAQAVGCFNVCVGLQPNFHWAWYNRGLAYARQRNMQQAQADFRHTIELQPEVAKLYVSRARIALELKEPKDAIQDLDKALDLGAPAYAYFLRARARMAAGDKAGAKADHAKGLQEEPNDEKSCVEQGLALVNTDPKRALAAFDKALEINPRSFEGLQNKAAILSDKFHKDEESEKVLDQAVAWYPDSVLVRAGRGVLLARRGTREAAHRDAAEALLLDTQPVTLYQVANIYALTSQKSTDDRLKALQLLAGALRNGFGLACWRRA